MEREDLIIRSTSPIDIAALEADHVEQTVQNQTTASLVPRSRSHEDLQAMLQEPQSVQARDVQSTKKLQDMKKLMKQAFEFFFERSRSLEPDGHALKLIEQMNHAVKSQYPAVRNLNEQDFKMFQRFMIDASNGLFFYNPSTIAKKVGANSAQFLQFLDPIYSPAYLSKTYEQLIQGQNLYTERTPVNIHNTRFAHNVNRGYLMFQYIEFAAEILEEVFLEYQGRPLNYIIKNAMLCLYAHDKIFPKQLSDCLSDPEIKSSCEELDVGLQYDAIYDYNLFNGQTAKHTQICNFRNEKLAPTRDVTVLLNDMLKGYSDYKRDLMTQPFYEFVMSYAEFYLSKHSSLAAALENPNPYPDEFLVEFSTLKGMNPKSLSTQFLKAEEESLLSRSNYIAELYYFSRDHYRLNLDKVLYSKMVSVLAKKYNNLINPKVLEDTYIREIHDTIKVIFNKLKNMDLASPAYTRDDVNVILSDLKTLRLYLDTLTGTIGLIKGGDIKIQSSAKNQPVKKKKPVNKKKKKVQAPAPVVNLETPAPTAVPKKVVPVKMTPQKRQELESIKEISQRITKNLEKENQYYVAAKNYILSLMSNSAAQKLVEVLFAQKSNLKNIMSQKEMTLIVEQMSGKIGATSENLKGSNGFRFRVEDEIYTSHASSAEIGHKGHGGAVKGFRDFLIAVYSLSLKKR